MNARLASLDILRGLAAFAIVLQHWWQHFRTLPDAPEVAISALPAASILYPFYSSGARAVPFFFCLSGFMFFWLYSERIANREVKLRHFLLLRISRLYPLHLVTLIATLVLQLAFFVIFQKEFVYTHNDSYHIALNLSLTHYWGFEKGYSFNGPSWSISIEFALYILFFFTCKVKLHTPSRTLLLLALAWTLARYNAIPAAAIGFFTGGMAFHLFNRAERYKTLGIVCIFNIGCVLLWYIALTMSPSSDQQRIVRLFAQRIFELGVFPSTILAAALNERYFNLRLSAFDWLGKISYSVYLLHFPLQIAFAVVAFKLGLPPVIYLQSLTLIIFTVTLIGISLISFFYLEAPLQKLIRHSMSFVRAKS